MKVTKKMKQFATLYFCQCGLTSVLVMGRRENEIYIWYKKYETLQKTLEFRNYARTNMPILPFKSIFSNLIQLLYTKNVKVLLNCDIASVHALFHISMRL